MESQPDFHAMLRVLTEHEVRFIVVGGVAAALQGVPWVTLDLDIVHDRSAANVGRLLDALTELQARSRLHSQVVVKPDASHLSGPGHVLLTTRSGALDVLGSIGVGLSHDELSVRSSPLDAGGGLIVQVLNLEALIEAKQVAGRSKDLAALPTLRATLEERQRRGE